MIDDKDMYKELGENFRLTLRWRELLFAGFLAVIGSLAVGFYKFPQTGYIIPAWGIPVVGSLLAFIFLLLDRRCHEALLDNYRLGEALEKRAARKGYYAGSVERGKRPKHITHTSVLESLYVSTGIGFLLVAMATASGLAAVSAPKTEPMSSATNAIPFIVVCYWFLELLPGLLVTYFGYRLLTLDIPEREPISWATRLFVCSRWIGGLIFAGVGVAIVIWFLRSGIDLQHMRDFSSLPPKADNRTAQGMTTKGAPVK